MQLWFALLTPDWGSSGRVHPVSVLVKPYQEREEMTPVLRLALHSLQQEGVRREGQHG